MRLDLNTRRGLSMNTKSGILINIKRDGEVTLDAESLKRIIQSGAVINVGPGGKLRICDSDKKENVTHEK